MNNRIKTKAQLLKEGWREGGYCTRYCGKVNYLRGLYITADGEPSTSRNLAMQHIADYSYLSRRLGERCEIIGVKNGGDEPAFRALFKDLGEVKVHLCLLEKDPSPSGAFKRFEFGDRQVEFFRVGNKAKISFDCGFREMSGDTLITIAKAILPELGYKVLKK